MGERFVYVVGVPGGPVKIGVASNVERRLGAIQSGNERKLSVLFKAPVQSERAHAVERRAHNHLREFHLHGEWFSVGANEAVRAVQLALTDRSVDLPRTVGGRGRPKIVGREPYSTYVLRIPKAMHLEVKALAGAGKVAEFVRTALVERLDEVEALAKRRERSR